MSEREHIGPYELRGELGRGAMARVWRAWDPNLEREVAIKEPLFDPRLPDDVLEEMSRRFVKEGRTAARLQHPGIVSIYAADVYDGRPAIVMELINGVTLAKLLEKGSLGANETLDVLDQLLDAVGYAHEKGVIHRDIKPDNIFVDTNGHIKLSDFGIAHVDDASATHATMVGAVLGTPGYMSPEQATGASVDTRSDLFSIGVVGYEMLSGSNPFGADGTVDSTTLIYRIVHEPAPELPQACTGDLPEDIRPAIMAALNKDPQKRPQTAAAFKAMLHGETSAPTLERPVLSSSGQSAPVKKTNWVPYIITGAVCVVALVVLFGVLSLGGGGGGVANSQGSNGAAVANSAYYIAPKNDNVAIYTNSSAEPYEVTDIVVEDLSPSDQNAIKDHLGFSTIEEAQVKIEEFQDYLDEKAASSAESTTSSGATAQYPLMATITVTGEDGETRTATAPLVGDTQRVIPDSNTRPLTQEEVDAMSDGERYIAWKEIIAAETGYMFINKALNQYFTNCSWYIPNPDGNGYCDPGVAADNVNKLKNALDDTWWLHVTYP